jgi:hypothetical protein
MVLAGNLLTEIISGFWISGGISFAPFVRQYPSEKGYITHNKVTHKLQNNCLFISFTLVLKTHYNI